MGRYSGAGILANHYNGSICLALATVYPEKRWFPWLFTQIPIGYWASRANHKKYLDWLWDELNLKRFEDWYNVSNNTVVQRGGRGLLTHYQDSLRKALAAIYPHYKWLPWKFVNTQIGLWRDKTLHREFMDHVAEMLSINGPDGWYRVTKAQVEQLGGHHLLQQHYGGILYNALATVYPEMHLQPWRFDNTPRSFWRKPENHRLFFDWLGKELSITKHEDWYNVTQDTICKMGGYCVLSSYYDLDYRKALAAVYPEHSWQVWRFQRVPNRVWTDTLTLQQFVGWLSSSCGVLDFNASWSNAVQMVHRTAHKATKFLPAVKDIVLGVAHGQTKVHHGQKHLLSSLLGLGMTGLQTNCRHPALQFSTSSKRMELDIYIPHINLAFEYQGKQHYLEPQPRHWTSFGMMCDVNLRARDHEKKVACAKAGITLIEVPHSWDGHHDTLIHAIHHHRPDIADSDRTSFSTGNQTATKTACKEWYTEGDSRVWDGKALLRCKPEAQRRDFI